MISSTLPIPADATVPPLPVTLKKSDSPNSHASVVWATNTMSSERYSRRSPAATQKKKVFASWRSASVMLAETSRRKNTAARSAGCRRRVSCRKRRSSSMNEGAEGSSARRFTDSLRERRRSSRDRAPRRSQPSRFHSASSDWPTRGCKLGSFSSSHIHSMMSLTLNSSSSSAPPRSVPPAPFPPGLLPALAGPKRSPGFAAPWPTPCGSVSVRSLKR